MESKEEIMNYSIEPWQSQEEFIIFQQTQFNIKEQKEQIEINSSTINKKENNHINLLEKFIQSLSISNLKKSMIFLMKWDARGDNKMFCLPIILLVNTIIKIKENQIHNKDINSCHILAEVLIRIINIIMDQLRKSKKANSLNMYLIAKDLDLPEFIIDIRHSSTHKNLPSFNELIFAVEYMLYWIKIKLIDPKYNYFIAERKYFLFLLKHLNNNEKNIYEHENKIKKFASVSLEPEHLLTVITNLFINIKKDFKYNNQNNKVIYYNDSDIIKNKILLFKKILDKEKEIFILLIFSFVYQQIININHNITDNEEKEKYKQFILCFLKIINNNIPKSIKFNLKKCEILYLSVYNKLNQLIKDENKEYNSILNMFKNIFKHSNTNINHENDNDDIMNENMSNLRKNVQYIDLDEIEGNISVINIDDIKNFGEEEEDEYENEFHDLHKNNEKMNIDEEEINEILNQDEINKYKNYNSLIFD